MDASPGRDTPPRAARGGFPGFAPRPPGGGGALVSRARVRGGGGGGGGGELGGGGDERTGERRGSRVGIRGGGRPKCLAGSACTPGRRGRLERAFRGRRWS